MKSATVYDSVRPEPAPTSSTVGKACSRVCQRALLFALADHAPHQASLRLLALDGALLACVARALGMPLASFSAIEHALNALPVPALRRLLSSVSALVTAFSGSAQPTGQAQAHPAELDEWWARLRAAVRAELLSAYVSPAPIADARGDVLRGLLPVAEGPKERLRQYLTYPIADLVDAPIGLRVAIVAAVPDVARPQHAAQLLALDEAELHAVEDVLERRVAELLAEAGLPPCWSPADESVAAAELPSLQAWSARARLWRDALELDGACLGQPDVAIGRAIGARTLLLASDVAGEHLLCERLPDFRLGVGNPRSHVARAIVAPQPVRVSRWETTAVVDHVLFDALGGDELVVAATQGVYGRRAIVAAPLPGASVDVTRLVLLTIRDEWSEMLDANIERRERERVAVATRQADHERALAALVHEVSNPLAIIGNYLHILRTRPAPMADAHGAAWAGTDAGPALQAGTEVTEGAADTEAGTGADPLIGAGAASDSASDIGAAAATAQAPTTPDPREQYLQAMQDELQRATQLLRAATAGFSGSAAPRGGAVGQEDAAPLAAVTPVHGPAQMLRSVQLALQPLADARTVRLEISDQINGASDVPLLEAVRQILVNLVRNALEAAPPNLGWVRVHAAAHRYRDGRPHIVFEVADNGGGLAPDLRQRLTGPKASATGGAGLGIAIVHELARERVGGSLDYETTRDGALFRLWVPQGTTG